MVNRDEREFKISANAAKFIKSLPDDKRERVKNAIKNLIENNTETLNIKKLLPYPIPSPNCISNDFTLKSDFADIIKSIS